MLTQLPTLKLRLALDEFNVQYDTLLTNAITAVSTRFDQECNRTPGSRQLHFPCATPTPLINKVVTTIAGSSARAANSGDFIHVLNPVGQPSMKNARLSLSVALLCSHFMTAMTALSQGTAFTYQGRLADTGQPANGNYGLQIVLFDAASGGNPTGTTNTVAPVAVSNGLFTVALDFGSSAFDGSARWLEIAVRTNGSTAPYVTLAPRQPVTPTPYAVRSSNAALLNGQGPGAFAPATGSSQYVSKSGDTMTGKLEVDATRTDTPGGQFLAIGDLAKAGFRIDTDNAFNIDLYNGATWSNPLTIQQNTGNVGIGTANPASPLDVTSTGISSSLGGISVHGNSANGFGGIDLYNDVGKEFFISIGGSSAASHWANNATLWSYDANANLVVGTANAERMRIDASGNVGIGTTSPQARIEVEGPHPQLRLANPAPGSGVQMDFMDGGVLRQQVGHLSSSFDLQFGTGGTDASGTGLTPRMTIDQAGNVGIGTTIPQARLDVSGTLKATAFQGDGSGLTSVTPGGTAGGDLSGTYPNPVIGNNAVASAKLASDAGSLSKVSGGNVNVSAGKVGIGTTSPQAALHVNGDLIVNGTNTVKVLSITGGADVAEPFTMSSADIPKGAVVVIDDAHPGQLKLSEIPYDKRVAGIVSGAGGVNPGLTLTQHGLGEGGQNVALNGRVYALADAANGPIKPGDLLTTSDTPGHAMKVTNHASAQGAILGKAMGTLKEGRGLVLVLVTLQ